MPGMNLRFRKQFPLLGKFLHWTISKRGVSLNMHMGPFSRSWGTMGNTTTLDAPGHLGFSWRKQTRRHHMSAAEHEALVTGHRGETGLIFAMPLVILAGLIEAAHIWLHPFSHVTVTGHPLTALVLTLGVLVVVLFVLRHTHMVPSFFLFVLGLLGVYVQWKVFHGMAWHDVHHVAAHAKAAASAATHS